MVENVNLGFLFLGQNHFSPLGLRNKITLANSPGKQQQVWKGPTKGKNIAHVYFILAYEEGYGILTSFLPVFITSNIPLFQIQVSAMNYILLAACIQKGLGLRSLWLKVLISSNTTCARWMPRLSGAFWSCERLSRNSQSVPSFWNRSTVSRR